MKKFLFLIVFLGAISTIGFAQSDTSNSGYFLTFVKKVYLNPTVYLRTQEFKENTNLSFVALPDQASAGMNAPSGFEKGLQKILRFLMESDGGVRFYFDADTPTQPFHFWHTDNLWCKFKQVDIDSINYYLNVNFADGNVDMNNAIRFETSIDKALDYVEKCINKVPGECGVEPQNETAEINTKPLHISLHNRSNSKFDSDTMRYEQLEFHYAKAFDVHTQQNWYAPSKLLVPNEGNEALALAIHSREGDFLKQNLKIELLTTHQVLSIDAASTEDSVFFSLPSSMTPGDPWEIVITYKSPKDSITYTVGFFMVNVMPRKTKSVVLISANNFVIGASELTAIEQELVKIYDPVGVSFELSVLDNFVFPSELPTTVIVDESNLLSNYADDLKEYVSEVKDLIDYDDDTYYLVVGLATEDLEGYMPRARNIGFIFNNTSNQNQTLNHYARIIGHELGHGIFHFTHIFCEEELGESFRDQTPNLMGYSPNPRELYLHQWNFIQDPAFVSWFGGDDEEGESRLLNKGKIPNYFRNTDKTVSFLTPTLKIVRLAENVEYFSLSHGIAEDPNWPLLPSGTLWEFQTKDGVTYKARINGGNFLGYFAQNDAPFSNYILPSSSLTEQTQAIFSYYDILGAEYVRFNGLTCGMYTGQIEKLPDLSGPEDWEIKGCDFNKKVNLISVPWFNVQQNSDGKSPNSSHFRAFFKKIDKDRFGKQVVLLTKAIEISGQYPDLLPYVTNSNNINEWKEKSSDCVAWANISNGLSTLFTVSNPIEFFVENYTEQADGPTSVLAGYFDVKVDFHNWDESKNAEELLLNYIETYKSMTSFYQAKYDEVIEHILTPRSNYLTVNQSTDYIVQSAPSGGQVVISKMTLRNALNAMSLEQLSHICPRTRVNLVAIFLDNGETEDLMELEIVKLFETCIDGKDAVTFLMLLNDYTRSNQKHILGEMLDKIDDQTCFIGSDNFTALSRAFCGLYNSMYNKDNYISFYADFYDKNMRPFIEEYQKNYEDVQKIKSAYITYNYSSAVYRFFKSFDQYNFLGGELITDIKYIEGNGKIFYKNQFVNGFWILENGAENGQHFHPYDPIIFDDKGKVFSPYGYDADNLHPYPAFILYFAEKKASSKSATELIQLGVDLLTFVIPGGAALRIVGLIDKTCAAASIVSSMTQYTAPEFSQAFGLTSGLLGLTSINPSDFVTLGKNLDNVNSYRTAINTTLSDMSVNMKPIDNYNAEVIKTCENIDANVATLNEASTAYLKEFLKKEKKLAQVEGRIETIARINTTLQNLGSPIEASTGLLKMEELLNSGIGITKNGDNYMLLGKTLGKVDGGKLKLNLEYIKSDFSKLGTDADLVAVMENVEYKKGWMGQGASSGTSHVGDILIFKKDQNIYCLDGVNCFTENTIIQTVDGEEVIQNITVNDSVITFNEKTGKQTVNKVTNVFKRSANTLQRLIIGRDTILTTPEHPFYHHGQWLKAAALSVGMVLQSPFGADTVFANTAIEDTNATVYNFTVEHSHTYVVGTEYLLVHNDCEKIGDLMNGLPNVATKRAFANALKSNENLVEEFINGTVRLDDWQFITSAKGLNSILATDVATLKKVGSLRKNKLFLDAIGGQEGLSDLLKANVRARCVSCGTSGAAHMKLMDEYLADVEHFVINFKSTDGFPLVLVELKKINSNGSANYAMEGAAFMLDYIKKNPQFNKNSIAKFDGKFDLDPDAMNLCSNCRFDIELNQQGNNIKYEFKSWGSVAINKIGTPSGASFTNQFKAYLADADDISKIQYIFDANKFSDVNTIKNRFKILIQNDPETLFNINPNLFMSIDKIGGGKIADWEDLEELINHPSLSFDQQLFSFIKLY